MRSALIRRRTLLALAVVLTVVSAATWLLAEVVCNLSDGQAPGTMDPLCGGSGRPGRAHLALAAAVIVPLAYLLARRTGRPWIFATGAAAAMLACGSVWLWG